MREFRARHADFIAAGVRVAGVTLDSLESCRTWARRLRLPYPLLSDVEREAGGRCHVLRRISIVGWNIEFFRRTTLLVDRETIVRGVWGDVKIRGHARQVLDAARALEAAPPPQPAPPERI